MAYSWPVPLNSPITQYFAANPYSPVQPAGHTGMDFGIPVGTNVTAIGAGTVLWADWATKLSPSNPWYINPAYAGIVVLINHGNIISCYAHLDSTALNIGQKVTEGQIIGKSGNTGLSSGPHLHFEIFPNPITGVVNWLANRLNPLDYITKTSPAPAPLSGNQRKVGAANINQRSAAKTSATVVRVIKANTVETFTGFVRGEKVALGGVTSDVWFRDSQGYVWAGGFTSQSTTGLPDQTPIPDNWRKTGTAVAKRRAFPRLNATVLGELRPNTQYIMKSWTTGDTWEGSNIWFEFRDGGWIHSKLFTSQATTGLTKVATPVEVQPTWRKTGTAVARYRKYPSFTSEVLGELKPNTNYIMKSYTNGDVFEGSDVWFQNTGGWWAHSKLFTSQATTSLSRVVNPTPKPAPEPIPEPEPEPTPTPTPTTSEKTVVSVGVRLRDYPSVSTVSAVKSVLPGGTKIKVAGYVISELVEGSTTWFELDGDYIHSSGVTDASIEGLTKKATPALPGNTGDGLYSFTPDFDFVEYKPANTWNMQNGNFPANPEKIVIHQFDAIEKNPSIEGVISWFQTDRRPNVSSAHFVVSGSRIVQMVSLKDRAFHAGAIGNDYIGIEVDPDEDVATVSSVKKLIAALNKKYNKTFTYVEHKDVPGNATQCGVDIHLEKYSLEAPTPPPAPVEPTPVPVDPEPVPVPVEPSIEPDAPTDEQIAFVLDYLLRQISKKQV